ncbi:nicotinate-nucleotide--dimethylbenzimidazole phosphoribosyltransferase [Reichenbachiella carrageenanivorans]|uniref:Nicotinate-nucleotide--dimethylbenzimidazole phosphoribosyltransferase n=1 Tax=Reichenbachiella carrageenanivorans TaxID=2979869 RepID=A0ABY6CW38_9BACT|nr:nicotinate-nucleotide--dimethylbenzimidazole phosphoribosyltransferase [Reichenbachiella carrageenanivorans]UXX78083.1 nicotinate-nucleotide--dimethylbenzimidazole phosphoribosyltransferase [Reichenbachiella carrageenanivorans]
MTTYDIPKPTTELDDAIAHKINFKTKPLGALGQLESLAKQICQIQQTLTPVLTKPSIVVFAADHGLAKEGVSAYPQEVTHQMVLNFLGGGAAINVFSEQQGIDLSIVDAGVNFDFGDSPNLIHAKIAMGTGNALVENAMSKEQLTNAINKGAEIVRDIQSKGSNIIGFGEMGIGNTSAASLIMSHICQIPIEKCVGRGTGVDDDGWQKKLDILKQVQQKHAHLADTAALLQAVGGFEITMMIGAMLQAAALGMVVLVDGFISTSAYLCAQTLEPNIQHYAIFCHQSDESGHQQMLEFIDADPLLKMNLRLGEGTGCALAYPLLQSSVDFINKMASFESAGVSNKD